MSHEHEHEHQHEHEHEHEHDESCDCEDCALGDVPGVVRVEWKTHDEAIVVSGALTVFAQYGTVREELRARLEDVARAVNGAGGVVGHIKASAAATQVDMFSVTDAAATVKRAPESEIKINVAAIVFLVPPEDAQALVKAALEAVLRAGQL